MVLESAICVAESFFDDLAGFTRAFLDAADELVALAFDETEIVIGKGAPALFQFSFGDVPVAFELESVHGLVGLFLSSIYHAACHLLRPWPEEPR